jgi:hypothetical protein
MGAAWSGGGAGDPGLGVAPRWGGPVPAQGPAGAATVAHRLEGAVALAGQAGRNLLCQVPGIGIWTAAEVAQRAWADADAVSVGDYHIPSVVRLRARGQATGRCRHARGPRALRATTAPGRALRRSLWIPASPLRPPPALPRLPREVSSRRGQFRRPNNPNNRYHAPVWEFGELSRCRPRPNNWPRNPVSWDGESRSKINKTAATHLGQRRPGGLTMDATDTVAPHIAAYWPEPSDIPVATSSSLIA